MMPKHYKDKREPVPGADMFMTEEEAMDRADEIGCEGTHSMDEDGQTIYMPCSTHEAYDEIMGDEDEQSRKHYDDKDHRAPVPGADKFTTEEEALDRAEELGCEGTHTMDEDGQVIYMPCSTHDIYDELAGKEDKDETRPYHEDEDDDKDKRQSEPAPKDEQITGSDKNEPGSAAGDGGDIKFSEATETALRNKVTEHNEAMTAEDKPRHTRTTYAQLAKVYRRGSGAYSSSHRPGISRAAWSMARVNAYLYLLRNGRPKNAAYVTDNDLLPEGHPKSSRALETAETRQVNLDPPAYMRAAARRGVALYEDGQAGDGVTDKTVREARLMIAGSVTADKWVRTRAWIARHLVDLDAPAANPEHKDYPSRGVVAHLLWGSGPTKRAAQRTLEYAEGVVARIEKENEGRKGSAVTKLETRTIVADIEVRQTTTGMTFTGYAALFDSPSEPLPFTERIAPGAFTRSLKLRNDIKMLYNHDSGQILGSTRAGTLQLEQDNRGLRVTAELPQTTTGKDAQILLQRGDIDSMSFGFSVPKDGDEWSEDGRERILKSVRLHEVSLVAFPAYAATSGTTQVRGLDRVAQRASVDSDELAEALIKVETGDDLTDGERDLLQTVIDELAPKTKATENPKGDLGLLWLAKKKIDLLEKGY